MKKTLLASLLMLGVGFTATVQASGHMPKVYATGEALPKPMQMTGFSELTYARKVPDITMLTVDNKEVKLSDYKGKLLMINLWATWCPPCVQEIPGLEKFKAANTNSDISIVSLSIDQDPENVQPFLDKHGFTEFETLLDPTGQMEKVMPTNVVPATYMFDGAGNLVGFVRGFMHWDDKTVQPFMDTLIQKYADKS
ncbi:TlpA family protein disulfide reductase [Shewanella marina]|uniref:TlpA family protein disulfide reductase n=1 Tax=Shewanella marina TaxID=487319 RepID=UPI000471CFA7|nr:TlpA disulfide reductase family protein [Shewanella marina]